ncbi:MAG TPA: nitroreductase family protein [Firmicutes bacterium]|nr:nitroreductase family protein [Bacillota bacterium]
MTKDVIDAIRERRSVRRYQARPIPDATLGRLLECAVLAPSAGNVQAWHFYVVKDEKRRQAVAAASHHQLFVAQAPVVLVVCADLPRMANRYGERGTGLYVFQDTAAAVQNILLAATAFGLATCWVGSFDEQAVAEAVGADPAVLRPMAVIPVGYPAEEPAQRPRRPLDEVVTVLG